MAHRDVGASNAAMMQQTTTFLKLVATNLALLRSSASATCLINHLTCAHNIVRRHTQSDLYFVSMGAKVIILESSTTADEAQWA